MRLITIIAFLIASFSIANGQLLPQDKALLSGMEKKNPYKERTVTFGLLKNKSKLHPVNLTFGSLMFVYQKTISKQISANCLYSPSCSVYSKQLFLRYGFIKGLFTSTDRIMRCDRISATDILKIDIDHHDHKKHENISLYSFENHKKKHVKR